MKLLIISAILNSAYSQWLHTCSHTLPSLASRSAQYLHLSVASYLSFCTSVYANERVVFFVCVCLLSTVCFLLFCLLLWGWWLSFFPLLSPNSHSLFRLFLSFIFNSLNIAFIEIFRFTYFFALSIHITR